MAYMGSLKFMHMMEPYLNNKEVFNCPTDEYTWDIYGYELSYICCYALHRPGTVPAPGTVVATKASELTKPTETISMAENTDFPSPPGQFHYGTHGKGVTAGMDYIDWGRVGLERHGKGANYLFGDAHGAWMTRGEAMRGVNYHWTR